MSFAFETAIDPILQQLKNELSSKVGSVMQAFHAIDKDNSQQLSTEEFRTVLKEFGIVNALATGTSFSFAATMAEANSKFWPLLVDNWKIWVVPQLINFRFVPPSGRVAFASAVALVWSVVQSIAANK